MAVALGRVRLKVNPRKETSILELSFRKSLVVVSLLEILDKPDNVFLDLRFIKNLLLVTLTLF